MAGFFVRPPKWLKLTLHYIRTLTRQQGADLLLADFQQLRREARRTIDRLIDFLDRSDPYVMTELEDERPRGLHGGRLLTELLTNSVGPNKTGRDEQVPPSLFCPMFSTGLVPNLTEGDDHSQIWRPVLYQLSYTPSDLNLLTFPCPRKELSANIGELSTLYSTEA
jgi:hypothetical protein